MCSSSDDEMYMLFESGNEGPGRLVTHADATNITCENKCKYYVKRICKYRRDEVAEWCYQLDTYFNLYIRTNQLYGSAKEGCAVPKQRGKKQ